MSSKLGKPRFGKLGRAEPLHKKVAARISREIASGRLQPGDRLPTENELARTFEVSRNVVREAIACLRADGVVDSRQGLGAFVVQPELRQSIRIDTAELRRNDNLRSLFELRALLEIEAAGLAAERRDSARLARIKAVHDAMAGDDRWSEAGIDADLDFHRAIAEATGNGYLSTVLTYFSQQMRDTIISARSKHGPESIVAVTVEEHQRIYDAVAAGHADRARAAMRDHIRGAARRLSIDVDMQSL